MSELTWLQMLRIAGVGAVFAFNAGFTNALTLSCRISSPSSHMTGTLARLGLVLARPGPESTPSPSISMVGGAEMTILTGFIIGATISGSLVGPSLYYRMRVSWRYGVGLIAECGLLLAALALILYDSMGGIFCAAMAMGMQNGMTTIYSGALLRTTHITGIWTDIGVVLGQLIHQAAHRFFGDPSNKVLVRTEVWRLKFLIPVMVFFAGGSTIGFLAYAEFQEAAFIFPIVVTGISGLLAIMYDYRVKLLQKTAVHRRVVKILHTVVPGMQREDEQADPAQDSLLRGAQRGEDEENDEMTSRSSARGLTVRGDWDSLPHTLFIRNAARHLVNQPVPTPTPVQQSSSTDEQPLRPASFDNTLEHHALDSTRVY